MACDAPKAVDVFLNHFFILNDIARCFLADFWIQYFFADFFRGGLSDAENRRPCPYFSRKLKQQIRRQNRRQMRLDHQGVKCIFFHIHSNPEILYVNFSYMAEKHYNLL